MADEKIRVLLFGLGAIGGFYCLVLSRNHNVALSVVARSNYEQVKETGLRIESQNHGNHSVKFNEGKQDVTDLRRILRSPQDSDDTFDYIVCTNKAVNPENVPPLFKPVTSDNTTFVIIQNGVGNEQPFRQVFPNNTVISCITWVGAIQASPGLIKHTKSENTQLGLFPNPKVDAQLEKHRLDTFASFLREGGTVFQVEDNIQIKRWEKVVWNVAWNPLTTLTDVDTQTWLRSSSEAEPMTRRLMREVIDVAKRCDVPLGHELVDELLDKIRAMPGIFSSMHTDSKTGRPLEVDVILGYTMKKALEFEMDVPVLSAVYALTMAVNGRLESGQ